MGIPQQTTQTEVLIPPEFKELFNPYWRNIVYYGGRASAKSESVGRSLIMRGRKEKLRILCTRELQMSIKDSVHKLLKDIIELYGFTDYKVTYDTIINKETGTEFIFKGLRHNINEIKSMQGIDICWVEEAQSITDHSIDVLTPTIRKDGSQIIWTFNRFTELDPVYVKLVMNKPAKTFVMHINYTEMLKYGIIPDVILLEAEEDKKTPALYAHKWLGEPLGQADMAIIARDMVLKAMRDNEIKSDGEKVIGVDVARMGNDRTVFWKRKGLKSQEHKILTKQPIPKICDALEHFAQYDKKNTTIKVDDTGVGGGVTDEMKKRGYKVIPINFGSAPNDKDKYPNWISEAWFYLAEQMPNIQLLFNTDLLMELTTRQWKQDTRGRRAVEGKNEYKKRGYRSPDIADAVVICYAPAKVEPKRIIF